MGYVFPKRIKDAIAGETNIFGRNFYLSGGLTNEEKEEFEKQRKEKEDGKSQKIDAIRQATNPWYCPTCDKMMRKRLDTKYYNKRGMCMDCVIKAEGYLKTHGLFESFEKEVALRNYKSWLLDVREQAVDFANNLKDVTKIVNHDGTFDTLRSDNTTVKKFIASEIEDIDRKLKEVEDVDIEISAEEKLGINLIDIIKNIIEREKNVKNDSEIGNQEMPN